MHIDYKSRGPDQVVVFFSKLVTPGVFLAADTRSQSQQCLSSFTVPTLLRSAEKNWMRGKG
ncbi:Hypothetical protein SMAX5B_013037 [Scophthalmus maximus]|uniref:Uncharacterized protein n=1 Tax=Scophthalmus maximus TaxID=52904 RepID=A0A2U9BFC7_SCOMX|nr:Hypothetical protein SMAX5B_013037 [Scophthalmus maximus]